MNTLDTLVQYAKTQGFIYQGSEIYGGLANTWDYGPLGALLKQNIKKVWIQRFQKEHLSNVLLDSSILLNSDVWKASGHVGGFSDPLTECKSCNQRFRVDNMIKSFDSNVNPDGWTFKQMEDYMHTNHLACPNCKKHDFSPIRGFNMMFQTYQGVVLEQANQIYLRPETAQGIFINFRNIQRTTRSKLPFGVCQIGKSFRNEITPGNFIFRTREFEQMELEFFCKPGTELEWFDYWRNACKTFLLDLGMKEDHIIMEDHKEEALAHYSNATTDILYQFPWGFDELWGIASRTDFDLKAHETHSKQSLDYQDPETNEKYIPFVIEPSVGVERLILAFLNESLVEETLENEDSRTVLKIHPALSPYKIAVLPLVKKLHKEKALEITQSLAKYLDVTYDDTQNIGKRYRRQDAIGTYFCVTVDHQTLDDHTVTIRHRDTMEQERIHIKDIRHYTESRIEF
jgi:glycyl-tRNA synthetase